MARKPPRSAEERLARAQRSMTPGTLGGRVATASPLAVDQSRLPARLRTRPKGAAGFDATADPVVIGAGAAASNTESVSIGRLSNTHAWQDAVAIGNTANVKADDGISIGRATVDTGANAAISIGLGAYASAAYAVSLGYSTDVEADAAVGIGYTATSYFTNAVALGPRSQTTHTDQIMLGASTAFVEIAGDGLVQKDTATGTRYLIQITSGALVLNPAP